MIVVESDYFVPMPGSDLICTVTDRAARGARRSLHISKPDADNPAKLAMDVLKKTGGLGTLDDCALAKLEVEKLRAS